MSPLPLVPLSLEGRAMQRRACAVWDMLEFVLCANSWQASPLVPCVAYSALTRPPLGRSLGPFFVSWTLNIRLLCRTLADALFPFASPLCFAT